MSNEPDDEDPEDVIVHPDGPTLYDGTRGRRDHIRRLTDMVDEKLAEGLSYVEVTDLAIEATGCSHRTATRAIAAARKRWADANTPTIEERRAELRAKMNRTRSMALGAEDFKAAVAAERNLMHLEGLASASLKVEHSGQVGLRPIAAMSPAERRAEIEELRAKQLAAGEKPVDGEVVEVAAAPARKRGN